MVNLTKSSCFILEIVHSTNDVIQQIVHLTKMSFYHQFIRQKSIPQQITKTRETFPRTS